VQVIYRCSIKNKKSVHSYITILNVFTVYVVVLAFSLRPRLNPLNAELNPICHLLALLGAHPILHISRIRVKQLLVLQF